MFVDWKKHCSQEDIFDSHERDLYDKEKSVNECEGDIPEKLITVPL